MSDSSATAQTVFCQAPPSMGFSRQEYWHGLPFLSPRNLPDPGMKPGSPALQADALPTEPLGESLFYIESVNSIAHFCLTLWDPMDCSMPGLPVHHQLPEFSQTHVHWVGDAIQPSHLLLPPSPPAFNLFQHQGLFQWVSSSHQVAKVLELQLWYQSFQWTFRVDFL